MNRALLLAVTVVVPLAAFADDASDRKDGDADLAKAAAELDATCGKHLVVTYDWESEKASPGKPAYQGPTYCRSAVEGLKIVCGDPVGKAVIGESVNAVACRLEVGAAKKNPNGPLLALEGSTVTVAYDWPSPNLDSETHKWAMKVMTTPGPNGPVTVTARSEKAVGEADFPGFVEEFQKQCGAIKVSYDFASEKGHDAKPAWQGYYYCRDAIHGLAMACQYDGKKDFARTRFTEINCRYEDGASKRKDLDPEYQGAAHVLKGKTLSILYDWNNGNLDSAARKWLKKLK